MGTGAVDGVLATAVDIGGDTPLVAISVSNWNRSGSQPTTLSLRRKTRSDCPVPTVYDIVNNPSDSVSVRAGAPNASVTSAAEKPASELNGPLGVTACAAAGAEIGAGWAEGALVVRSTSPAGTGGATGGDVNGGATTTALDGVGATGTEAGVGTGVGGVTEAGRTAGGGAAATGAGVGGDRAEPPVTRVAAR